MTEANLHEALRARFGSCPDGVEAVCAPEYLTRMASRGSCRSFREGEVPLEVLETLSAVALSAPSKSDLQQRDILLVTDPDLAAKMRRLLGAQDWIAGAPSLVVFLANNRRQRRLHQMHGIPFANDHLDAFFNASVDAGVALAFFVAAAEAAGLGCCPISTIRNHLPEVRDLLGLPDHVFPVAGLAVGVPATDAPKLSPRLPLSKTVHRNRFADITEAEVQDYDARRLNTEASTAASGAAPRLGWSEAKARQYNDPQRVDFADFIRSIGFRLE
jgi:nitroreductase/FMN reductase [NAD(P)H]